MVEMTQAEMIRTLRAMVDQLESIPPDLFDAGLPLLRIHMLDQINPDLSFTLVCGAVPLDPDAGE